MSEINVFNIEDYLAVARSRVTEQFKYNPDDQSGAGIFDRYIQLLLGGKIELQEVFRQLMQERSIDTAVGAQLDIIGDIVGQPRELIDTALLTYFAYLGYPDAESYGDLNDSGLGGYYRGINEPLAGNTLLNDEQYRLFIKAKIIKNSTNATPNQLLDFIKFVFGSSQNQLTEEGDASYTLLVGKELSTFEKTMLTYVSYSSGYPSRFVPKPIGVRVNYGTYVAGEAFAFQGVPGAKGYGDLDLLPSGTFGYGLGYGLFYGESDYGLGTPTWSYYYDGSTLYDGSPSYVAIPTYPGLEIVGGVYASLL
jgi:hypothetical protein